MAERPRHLPHLAGVAALVVLGAAACAVPRTDSAAGPALASPVAPVRPDPVAPATGRATAAPSSPTSPTTVAATAASPSATPTPTSTPTSTGAATTSGVPLRADSISFGPPTRSVHFARPAGWSETRVPTPDGARARNRTIYRSPDGGLSLTVEIAPATTAGPLTSAFDAQAARSDRGTPGYRLVRIENGPGDGATWEFLSTVSGVARHSADWFATVGSTDLALFATGPARDWDTVHGFWGRVVDSVRVGEEPPGYTPPTPPATPSATPSGTSPGTPPATPSGTPSATPSGTPLPTSPPTPTVAPTQTVEPTDGPTPPPRRTPGVEEGLRGA